MLWVYLHCYQLSLDAHQRSVIENSNTVPPPSRATVVYCKKTNRIMQLDRAAQETGIEIGNGLAQTAALCPQVHILPFSIENEKKLLTQLAHRLYPIASDIALNGHNGLAIRLDNLVSYYGSHRALWNTLSHELSLSRTRYHFATAWTVEAARVLAQHKVNTYLTKPKNIENALASCSLALTELIPKVIESLARTGIKHLHQLLAMPVHELGRRFDNNTITYLTALRGETFPRMILFKPHSHFSNIVQLPFDIENTQYLLPFVSQQLEDLSHYLRARNLQTSSIHVHIHFRESPVMDIAIHSALPQASAKSWQALLSLKCENTVLPEPATGIAVTCKKFESVDNNNGDFFNHRFNEIAQKQLVGRLNAKLGDNSTFQPKAADSHQFDYMTVKASSTPNHIYSSDITPTFTFTTPTPLTQFTQVCFGPVRLDGEWWHNTPHKRDYFIAQTEQGVRMLIFKDEQSKWWTQGIFC